MERLRGSTATALAGAAKTWKIGSFQTSVARFTATLVLALLLSPQGCDVQPVAAVKQQRRSFEDTWKAQAAERVESFTAVAAAFATTGNETRRALHQIARVGEEGEEGVGRRCWISENGRSRCYANVFFVGFEKCGK